MRIAYVLKQVLLAFLALFLIWWIVFVLTRPEMQGINVYLRLFIILFSILFFGWIIKYFLPSWSDGAVGEHWVSQELNKLPKDKYLHVSDFHKGKTTNIDFVVIGVTGIYTIEVKYTKNGIINFENDYLTINGSRFEGRDCLSQAYHESKIIQEHIFKELGETLPVTPILVFANHKVKLKFGMKPQKGVYVIGINWLTKLIQHGLLDNRFTSEMCSKIKENLNKYGCDIV